MFQSPFSNKNIKTRESNFKKPIQSNSSVLHLCIWEYVCICVSLKVASKLLHATSGPVKAVEGSLYQRRHDAAHVYLVSAAVPLTIVLHSQPAKWERETEREREMLAKEKNQWRQIRRCGWRTTTTKSERKQQFLLFYESSLHMSGLMCHHKCRGETILMVQRAAPYWMAHACHRGVT